jgi:hypothetical protein
MRHLAGKQLSINEKEQKENRVSPFVRFRRMTGWNGMTKTL